MKYFFAFLIFPFFFSCNALSEESIKERLQVKADSALAFCTQNKMNMDYCFLIDMKIHSGKNRFFVWDFNEKKVIHTGLCCHGKGEGSTRSQPVFSNVEGSNCTSLGKYKVGIRSYSQWGINVHYKLHGLDTTNNNAFKRIVVLHSFTPVPSREIYPIHLIMGWSAGCPVISDTLMTTLDELLKDSKKNVLLWIYY